MATGPEGIALTITAGFLVVPSWLEGAEVDGPDPWNLEADGLLTNEWRWYERNRGPAVVDEGTDGANEEGHTGTD